MASNRSQAKHAKALRRKKMVTERNRLLPAGGSPSLAERARRAAAAPLHCCLVQEGLFERGNGMALVARKTGFGEVTVAVFLLDTFCLGIKDVFFREMPMGELDEFVEQMGRDSQMSPVEPAYARKLLTDLAQYARSLGFEPPADLRVAELLFGDVRAEDCTIAFEFGDGGMPHYIPGPSETPAKVRQHLNRLRAKLGDDGFLFSEFSEDDADAELDEFGIEGPEGDVFYDPAVAPDAADWLGLDEDERLRLAEAYHRRAGIPVPKPTVHAAFHAMVENQLAADDPPAVRRALVRLMAEGLDRHEAVHAVAWVLTDQLHRVATGSVGFSAADYEAALDELTESLWRSACQGGEDD